MRPIVWTCLLFTLCAGIAVASEHGPALDREAAFQELLAGNARYVADAPQNWSASHPRREELVAGQHPFACIITCSDSRVPPELLFDQSLGDLFVVRLAGNIITPEVAGSVEYAVEHLGVPVVVVLGHSHCGAVGATLAGGDVTGPVASLVEAIKPAVAAAREKGYEGEDLAPAVIRENARRGAAELMECSRAVETGVREGHVTLLSAVYSLETGEVAWETQFAAPVAIRIPATPVTPEKHAAAAPKAAEAAHGEQAAKGDSKAQDEKAHDQKAAHKEAIDTYARRHR